MSTPCQDLLAAIERRDPAPALDAQLAEHARSCASCAEAVRVATWLRRAAKETPPRSGLPSASHLWWRARIIRDLVVDESRVERATRSARWTQAAGLVLLCLLIALGLAGLTASLAGGLETQDAGAVPWGWLGGLFVAGTLVPLLGFAVLWWVWREA